MLQSGTTASSLQKIYEESYLTCSTAVYYEGQGNEDEAMRCWKAAVEQIRRQYSDTAVPEYAALSETEKALSDSLRELEYQAQERIDLLEALKLSRDDDPFKDPPSQASDTPPSYGNGMGPSTAGAGYIGGGTIPAITYGELSRPELSRPAPPVPPRPSLNLSRTPSDDRGASSEPAVGIKKSISASSGSSRRGAHPSLETYTDGEAGPSYSRNVLSKRPSRSPNKDKQHSLRTTLRSNNSGEPSLRGSRASNSNPSAERQGASKAATLAWSALGLSPSFGRAETSRRSSAAESPALKTSVPTLRPSSRKPLRDSSPGSHAPLQWDSNSRRLVPQRSTPESMPASVGRSSLDLPSTPLAAESRQSNDYASPIATSSLSLNAAASALGRSIQTPVEPNRPTRSVSHQRPHAVTAVSSSNIERGSDYLSSRPKSTGHTRLSASVGSPNQSALGNRVEIRRNVHSSFALDNSGPSSSPSFDKNTATASPTISRRPVRGKNKAPMRPSHEVSHVLADMQLEPSSDEESDKLDEDENANTTDKGEREEGAQSSWKKRKQTILKHLPPGVDEEAAKQILNEIVVQGDIVHWSDIAGLEPAKKALREAVVYPFLRPDLFMGLREPATGLLLFGPPGTGKTMLARAVATESKSTFFSISASSLTSKYLGESEKLVRALFALAKSLAPSIIFVDEIDSLLSQRSGSGEHEATRRIKTEFLIQWSDLQRAAAGRDDKDAEKDSRNGDANRVLVLAATNLPWAIDEAARRRFVRRQYIPLPEAETRAVQLRTLLGQQKHSLTEDDIQKLVELTDGFSGSDITALAKDAAMGPLRSLGEALLMTKMDEIRPMELSDFVASMVTIRPSVSKAGLKEYEDWAKEFGERGG